MNLAERIKQIRLSKNLTYRQLSSLTGVDAGAICQWEKNRANSESKKPVDPRIGTLKLFCDGINYDFALFLAETGYINPERVCMNDAEADLLKAFRGNYDNNFIELNKNKSEKVEKGLEIGK